MDQSAHNSVFVLGRELFAIVQEQWLAGHHYVTYWGGKTMGWNEHFENAIWMHRIKAHKITQRLQSINDPDTEFKLVSSNELFIQDIINS